MGNGKRAGDGTKGAALQMIPAELLMFGDNGEAFERHDNLGKIKALSSLNAVAMLELGRRLMWHKANLAHGEFLQDIATLPFKPRTAARMMNAARKLGSNARAPALLRLGTEKVYDLAEEYEEAELKLLVEGKAIDGVTLDDVDKMTTRQLREALRKERQPKKRLADAEEKLKELAAENATLKGRKLAPTVEQAQRQTRMAGDRIDEACRALTAIAIPDESDEDAHNKVLAIMHGTIATAERQLQNIMADRVDAHIPR